LLWVEGKTFTDRISNDEGKTFSKFEVRKNLQQAIEALGGVRLSDRSVEEAAEKANQKELEDFRVEFSQISEAYYAGYDADTYVIRRADKAIWVVTSVKDGRAGVMVAEGPLPEAPAKQ
jgi:CHASE1-domain containing sensor protein